MNDYLGSMFIDDELRLDEKLAFVERLHADEHFRRETSALLRQELRLRSAVVTHVPSRELLPRKHTMKPLFRRWSLAAAAAVAVIVGVLFMASPGKTTVPYRFIVHRPDVQAAEIAGTFTDWKRIPMQKIGESGYWQIVLEIPRTEHRFTYILNDKEHFADPTILTTERDDFGGSNSVLSLEKVL
jgi:hypothetical protein